MGDHLAPTLVQLHNRTVSHLCEIDLLHTRKWFHQLDIITSTSSNSKVFLNHSSTILWETLRVHPHWHFCFEAEDYFLAIPFLHYHLGAIQNNLFAHVLCSSRTQRNWKLNVRNTSHMFHCQWCLATEQVCALRITNGSNFHQKDIFFQQPALVTKSTSHQIIQVTKHHSSSSLSPASASPASLASSSNLSS